MVFVFCGNRSLRRNLKFHYRGASVNPLYRVPFLVFQRVLYVCADLTRILSSLRRTAKRPGPPEKFGLNSVLCAFRIPFSRGGPAVGGDL